MKKVIAVMVVLMVMLMVSISMAWTKPLDGLPDYNGTYYGTPNTGSLYDPITNRFTTLYRDNYDRVSGYAGEGYGKHPGVDIRIPSGTAVKATLAGTAIRVIDKDQCASSTWGALVVVESDNPYKAGEKVYIGYAHLSDVDVSVTQGSIITEGQTLGKSGGTISDPCSGASTGAHLHFQVDKQHGGPYPWYPTGEVEDPDFSFEVPQYTYNPLPFIQGYGYHWNFSEDGFKELWTATNVNDYGVAEAAFWIDSELANAYMYRAGVHYPSCGGSNGYPCSREVAIEADIFTQWVLALDFKCTNNPAVVWFRNSNGDWGGISFPYQGSGYYTIPMTISDDWIGIITDLVVQPAYGGGCTANPGPEEFFIYQTYFLP